MQIHGREIGMKLTIGATLEIAKLTPNQSIDELGKVLDSASFADQLEIFVKLIAAMSKGYEQSKRFEDPGYVPSPLTEAEILSLDMPALNQLQAMAFAAYNGDSETTVEVEEPKKDNAPPQSA